VSIDPAKTQYSLVSRDIRPNVLALELRFPQATFVMHLRRVVLIRRVLPVVMIDDLPMHRFEIPTDELQSNHLILVLKLFLQIH
jgi:chemotaxis response regulator CheB